MIRDIKLIHCDEQELVVEIESYQENGGAIVSFKRSEPGERQPFAQFRQTLEGDGWQVELAGINHLGHNHPDTNSYVARRPHPPNQNTERV